MEPVAHRAGLGTMTRPPQPPAAKQHIRFATVFVLLVLATIGFVLFWQFVLQGSLSRPGPNEIVTEFLRLGLPNSEGFEVLETFPPREIQGSAKGSRAAVVRLRYQARNDRGQLVIYDRAFFVIDDQVKSMLDWGPDAEEKIEKFLEQAGKK
jgi:hypothetical protein